MFQPHLVYVRVLATRQVEHISTFSPRQIHRLNTSWSLRLLPVETCFHRTCHDIRARAWCRARRGLSVESRPLQGVEHRACPRHPQNNTLAAYLLCQARTAVRRSVIRSTVRHPSSGRSPRLPSVVCSRTFTYYTMRRAIFDQDIFATRTHS